MALVRVVYRSDSELSGSDRAVREVAFAIADDAARRNADAGLTGALMFVGGVFVQVLEGEGAAVETVFERICRDMRHRRLALLDFSAPGRRVFDTWSMVAFEGDARARSLFPTVSEATSLARNRMSANAAVELMRTLLARRAAGASGRPMDRLIATDVMT